MVSEAERPIAPKELGQLLGCGEKRARRLFADGEVPNAYRIGRRWFTDAEGVKLAKERLQRAAKRAVDVEAQ